MTFRDASTAIRRFGLGARPGDMKRIAGDPRGYVTAALGKPGSALLEGTGLQPSHLSLSTLRQVRKQQRALREQSAMQPGGSPQQSPKQSPQQMMTPSMTLEANPATTGNQAKPGKRAKPLNPQAQFRRDTFRREAAARLDRARTTDQPFIERLVMFWSDHFTVSALKGGPVFVTAGAFEREAIRPHVLGRFADMLKAVEQHPTMLIYLDNATSFGPSSRIGQRRKRGLNENLAREILELHTLGVSGGYTQADVTAFARILTGWSVAGPNGRQGEPGRFAFNANGHEPGDQVVLGKRYPDRGRETGETVLSDLARHPSTARHIATRMASHFVSDNPPQSLVNRLQKTFRETDGDLGELARTLATAPESWQTQPRKILPPYDFAVALMRAFSLEPRLPQILRLTRAIGQPLWRAPSPKGWPNEDDAWTGPSAIRERLRITEQIALQINPSIDPRRAAEDLFADTMSNETMQAVRRAEARLQGFELLIMSPEFLRR